MMKSVTISGSSRSIAAIVGVGPKLGRSIARKFAHQGYTVAILAPDLGRLSRLAEEIAREEMAQVYAIRIDCSDSKSVRDAFEGVLSLGFVEVLVYNANYQNHHRYPLHLPAANSICSFQHLPLETFQKSLAVSSIGAFHSMEKDQEMMIQGQWTQMRWHKPTGICTFRTGTLGPKRLTFVPQLLLHSSNLMDNHFSSTHSQGAQHELVC